MRGFGRSCPPARSGGSTASGPIADPAKAARIRAGAERRRHFSAVRGSKTPSAESRYGFRRRMCRDPSATNAGAGRRTGRSKECRSHALWCRAPVRRSARSRSWTRGRRAWGPAAGRRRSGGSPEPPPRRQLMMPRDRSASMTFAASTSGVPSKVGRRISGSRGASYGASTPVKLRIWPVSAF